MSPRVEADCTECVRGTYHEVQADGSLRCTRCGTVVAPDEPLVEGGTEEGTRGGNKGGTSVKAGTSSGWSTSLGGFPDLPPPDALACEIEGDALVAFDADPGFARFVLERAGLRFELGVEQVLVLDGCSVAVHVWHDTRGLYVLWVEDGWVGDQRRHPAAELGHSTLGDPQALALAELYMITTAGRAYLPGRGELVRAKRRALVDGGFAKPTPSEIPALPSSAPRAAVAVYEVARRLAEVRRPGEPFPLSARFLADWGPMSESTAREGRAWLQRNQFITCVDEADFGHPRRAHLWLAGDHPEQRWSP
jgi:hypothetical protein